MKSLVFLLLAVTGTIAYNQACAPMSQFMEYCNSCSCSADGSFAVCTKMYCDKAIWNRDGSLKKFYQPARVARSSEAKKVCKPLSLFMEYCNTCHCSMDGLSYACTRMFCDEDVWNKDGTKKAQMKTVSSDESALNQVCTPNLEFKEYCNTCICSLNGLFATCTKMYCDKNVWNKDGSRKFL